VAREVVGEELAQAVQVARGEQLGVEAADEIGCFGGDGRIVAL